MSRDETVYMAKLAEQAERYDEMVSLWQSGRLWGSRAAGLRLFSVLRVGFHHFWSMSYYRNGICDA